MSSLINYSRIQRLKQPLNQKSPALTTLRTVNITELRQSSC